MARKYIDAKKISRSYVSSVNRSLRVDSALIFGSYASGTQTSDSDIDLLIISRRFHGMPFTKRLELLNRLRSGDALTVPMDIIGVTPSEFSSFKLNESSHLKKIYKESKKIYP